MPDVWVVTDELEIDTDSDPRSFRAALKTNLQRGIQYVYIVPERTEKAEIEDFMRDLPRDKVRTIAVSDADWATLPVKQAIIFYNPYDVRGSNAAPRSGYYREPAEEDWCWNRLHPKIARSWYDRVATMIGGVNS